ncbi:MAG: preprotein translocase subunit SecG [Candidatus Binatia bacterium]
MSAFVTVIHILAAVILIAVVLLQSGKGADMGAAFGGGGSTVFGPSGPGNVLTKLTTVFAVVFMITSLTLAVLSARQPSVFDDTAEPQTSAAPVAPPVQAAATDKGPASAEPAAPQEPAAQGGEGASPGDQPAGSAGE